MNCKNCKYGLPWKNGDLSGVTCTYEEGECVKVTELEKKNKALRQDWEIMKNTIADYNDFCDKYMKLEKENAELKADLNEKENTVHTLDVLHKEAVRKYGEVNDQLTKAKEIIKKLKTLYFSPVVTKDDVKRQDEILNEAEQFLKNIKE